MAKMIIGLVGFPGSGKTTLAKLLNKKDFSTITLSTFIKHELGKLGKPVTRRNLQDVGDKMRAEKGADILVRLALEKINQEKIKRVVIDGIRNLAEIKCLKKEKIFYLVGLHANPRKRYQRLIKNKDKYNNIKNYNDFIFYELREDAGQKKAYGQQNYSCYLKADYFLDNNLGIKMLEKALAQIFKKMGIK